MNNTVTRTRRLLFLIFCMWVCWAGTLSGHVTNIHSTFGSDACSQITVSWRSPFVAAAVDTRPENRLDAPYAVAEYGTTLSYGATMKAITFESGAGLQHHAQLKDLRPGTTYHYRVRSGEQVGPDCTFRTALPADTKEPFTFALIGDVEGGPDGNRFFPELTAFLARKNIDFFVVLGDLAYYGQQQSGWDGFFRSGASLFQSCVFVPVLGDHGMERMLIGEEEGEIIIGRESPILYLDQFLLPDNGTKSSYSLGRRSLRGIWYAFDYGSAHIVSIENTQELTPPFREQTAEQQAPWVIEDLDATKATWRFILGHRAFYPSESESTERPALNERRENYRLQWDQILADGRVNLTFGAHAGGWTLSHPVVNGEMADEGQAGTVHMKLAKVGNYSKQPNEDDVMHWATLRPETAEEEIPAAIALVTVHPDCTDVVTLDWPKDREFHRFSLILDQVIR